MTKYKEYLRAKGIKLECDYGYLPCDGVEAVATEATDNCVAAVVYSNCAGAGYAVFNRYGMCGYFDAAGYKAYVKGSHCDPEFMAWLYDNGFTDQAVNCLMIHYSPLYSSYSVYAAFLHVRAGIMDEAAFYKLVSKRCQQTIAF